MNLPDYEASFKLLGNEALAHIVQMPGEHLPEAVLAAQKELDARKVTIDFIQAVPLPQPAKRWMKR